MTKRKLSATVIRLSNMPIKWNTLSIVFRVVQSKKYLRIATKNRLSETHIDISSAFKKNYNICGIKFSNIHYQCGNFLCVDKSDAERGGDSVKKNRGPPIDEIIPIYRRDSHEEVYCGSHVYPGRGVYLLKFDNSYSLWRSKTLYYRVYYSRWTMEQLGTASA